MAITWLVSETPFMGSLLIPLATLQLLFLFLFVVVICVFGLVCRKVLGRTKHRQPSAAGPSEKGAAREAVVREKGISKMLISQAGTSKMLIPLKNGFVNHAGIGEKKMAQ